MVHELPVDPVEDRLEVVPLTWVLATVTVTVTVTDTATAAWKRGWEGRGVRSMHAQEKSVTSAGGGEARTSYDFQPPHTLSVNSPSVPMKTVPIRAPQKEDDRCEAKKMSS